MRKLVSQLRKLLSHLRKQLRKLVSQWLGFLINFHMLANLYIWATFFSFQNYDLVNLKKLFSQKPFNFLNDQKWYETFESIKTW